MIKWNFRSGRVSRRRELLSFSGGILFPLFANRSAKAIIN